MRHRVGACGIVFVLLLSGCRVSDGSSWMGHRWRITNGRMAGVAPGRPGNVYVDENGFLHLLITKTGRRYTAAELFSQDRMGFGTYQWQIEGAVGNMDPSTVLGLFPYGPKDRIGIDGENELDIEFSKWGNTLCGGRCNADFTMYPGTGKRAVGPTEDDFSVSSSATLTTARLVWTSTSVTATVMDGLQPLGTTANVLHTWTFAPSDYLVRIPQQPVPVGMNLWRSNRRPSSSQEVILRAFEFVPQ